MREKERERESDRKEGNCIKKTVNLKFISNTTLPFNVFIDKNEN